MNTEIQNEIMKSFMSRVNKLTVGRSTYDKFFGTVTLKKAATETKNSSRKFSVSDSSMIRSGAYTLGGLRKALSKAINA